ncbi:aromatic ring-hydroxylating oxygenase subunit alpha [Paraglaciecola arctica]|uniref:Rieske (2Fe-2S) domain protein n=1 Tax=Paraglaciecola arctica BSs20135 TaxID=493475 RepID=K6Y273_9ALTE|nr:SRPBCC family protein [Paraglaciecola arctica]GAC18041.1 rieske (2Fe-2S) domain protein [Paraglaciecola arctica BSs20135]
MKEYMSNAEVAERVLRHVRDGTTDQGDQIWREPVANYCSEQRFQNELALIKQSPIAICPSAALAKAGDFITQNVAGVPLIVVRGQDKKIRAFKNACRHRGTQLVSGSGCKKAFVCPYHGWVYRLDGRLQGIPHEQGFPGFEKSEHGLSEVKVFEKCGLVFVQQGGNSKTENLLEGLPVLLQQHHTIISKNEATIEANWKVYLESFIEGYHIKFAHPETFYPFGYDNLNIIEFCGPHARVTFPFRRMESLTDVTPSQRDVSGRLTYVYHLFPNVVVTLLSHHTNVIILEPVDINTTRTTLYQLTNQTIDGDQQVALEAAKRDMSFVAQTGALEDLALVRGIQKSINSGANDAFTFGYFEPAIVHFHQHLGAQLNELI